MAVNRFVNIQFQNPHYQFHPIPLEGLVDAVRNKRVNEEQQYDPGKLQDLTDLSKFNVSAAYPQYVKDNPNDPESPSHLEVIQTPWAEEQKTALKVIKDSENNYLMAMAKAKQTKNPQDLREANHFRSMYTNNYLNAFNYFKQKEEEAKAINETTQKYYYDKNIPEANKYNYFKGNEQYTNSGYQGRYVATPNVDYVDPHNTIKAMVGDIEKTELSSGNIDGKIKQAGSFTDSKGFVTYRGIKGITADRVLSTFDSAFRNDEKLKAQIHAEVATEFIKSGKKYDKEVDDGNGGKITLWEKAINEKYADYQNEALKYAGIDISDQRYKDWMAAQDRQWAREDNKENPLLVGDPTQSKFVFDMTDKVPSFQQNIKDGLFKVDESGRISINKNKQMENNFLKFVKTNGAGDLDFGVAVSKNPNYGKVNIENTKRQIQMVKELYDVMKPDFEFSGNTVQQTIDLWNSYTKTKAAPALQMSPQSSEIESDNISRNWDNYDIVDYDNDKSAKTNVLDKERVKNKKYQMNPNDKFIPLKQDITPEGKMVTIGKIKRKGYDGDPDSYSEELMVRPKAETDDSFHNKIAQGILDGSNIELNPKYATKDSKDRLFGKEVKLTDNLSFVPEVIKEGGKNKTIFNIAYDGELIQKKSSQELMQFLNSIYYRETEVGKTNAKHKYQPKKATSSELTEDEE